MLLSTPPLPDQVFDLCVIGAGPVGLSLTLEASRLGMCVLVVEAGSRRSRSRRTASEDASVSHPRHHATVTAGASSGIGGTSWLWGGRCVPLEPIDFEERSFVAGSGWPLEYEEMTRWHERAAEYLHCGGGFDDNSQQRPNLDPILLRQQERWSRTPLLGRTLGTQALSDPAISVLTDATVTDLTIGPDDAVRTAQVRVGGQTTTVRARQFAIAGGGLKTTRLLLQVQRRWPSLAGGPGGPLGRYYTGHINGSIADITLESAEDFALLDFRRDADGTFVRRRLTLSANVQREQKLLNTAFYLGNPPFHDHRHRNGTLSALFFVMHVPVLGGLVARPETRQHNQGSGWRSYPQHLRNIARQPLRTAGNLARIIWRRHFANPTFGVFVVPNERGVYALRYHAEQICRPQNRVTLNGHRSNDGLPAAEIIFEYSTEDIESILRAHQVLDHRLRASGCGYLTYHHPEADRFAAVRSQAVDGYHQIGSTRMSDDPKAGVVDANCKVHGLSNLYVASSSVFPTAGEANPTFAAVCLAVRLAHHLAGATSH